MTSFGLFIFEKWCTVPSKSNKQKNGKKNCFCWRLNVNDENSRIRIRIRIPKSEAWISGSGSTPKFHGSGTLVDIINNITTLPVTYQMYHSLCIVNYGNRYRYSCLSFLFYFLLKKLLMSPVLLFFLLARSLLLAPPPSRFLLPAEGRKTVRTTGLPPSFCSCCA